MYNHYALCMNVCSYACMSSGIVNIIRILSHADSIIHHIFKNSTLILLLLVYVQYCYKHSGVLAYLTFY